MKNHSQLNEETKIVVSLVIRITDRGNSYAHFILFPHRSEVAQVSRPTAILQGTFGLGDRTLAGT